VLSRSLCSSLIVTNDLVICFHAWRRHPLRTLCRAIPRWISLSGVHTSLLIGGMRRRSLEDRLHLLSRRSAMTLRKPLRHRCGRHPGPDFIMGLQAVKLLTSMVPLEKVLYSFKRSCLSELSRAFCTPGAALRRHFRAISYSVWSDQALAVLARQPSTFAYPPPSMPS
jgi:hypothetical protein